MKEAEEVIPEGLAQISLAPVSTGLGEIFQYRLVVKKGYENEFNPMELRTIQDWIVRREMLGTPGVADINSYGGFVKQYEIAVNPERLRAMNLTLTDIFTALENNNENTGSAYIDKNPTAYFIRGIGLVKTLEDIEKIVVKTTDSGIPVLIRDIATVQFGSATRYGAFVVDTTEAVGGVVMMLKGANGHEVIENVKTRIESIQKSLPGPGKDRTFPYPIRSGGTGNWHCFQKPDRRCLNCYFHSGFIAREYAGRTYCCFSNSAFHAFCHLDDEPFWRFGKPYESWCN